MDIISEALSTFLKKTHSFTKQARLTGQQAPKDPGSASPVWGLQAAWPAFLCRSQTQVSHLCSEHFPD